MIGFQVITIIIQVRQKVNFFKQNYSIIFNFIDEYINDGRSSPDTLGINEFEYSEYPVDRDLKSRIGFRDQSAHNTSFYTDQYGHQIDYSNANDILDL